MIAAVLQARASSRRLPGKVLKPILGKPMLQHQIERILRANLPEKLVLATSVNREDDAVANIGVACGIAVYRGSLDDVLDRFYRAAEAYKPTHVVRLTGDCPLTDPALIDAVTRFAVEGGYDYASNTIRPSFPDGLDVEVAAFAALEAAWREATSKPDREHVMPFLHRQPGRFRLGNLLNSGTDLSAMRWTVDEPADFEMVKSVYEALYPSKPDFDMSDVLAFLDANPEIAGLNSGLVRNEGYIRDVSASSD
ncbi:MAG: glycosyltransferase family protein [Rhizobiaceae bacterium]|nr:glycosyltransferase family protein [Rhizobiaceae bacterium]